MKLFEGKTIGPKLAKCWDREASKTVDCPVCGCTCGQRSEWEAHLRNRHQQYYSEMQKNVKAKFTTPAEAV
jgi:hypothetical protein